MPGIRPPKPCVSLHHAEGVFKRQNESYCSYFKSLSPAFQADIVRVDCIHKDGGLWIDSNTLVISPLITLQKVLQYADGFLISERGKNGTKLCNGVFGSQAGIPLMKA